MKLYHIELYDFPWFYNTLLDIDYDHLASCEDMTYDEWNEKYEITHDNYKKYMIDTAKIYYDEFVDIYWDAINNAWITIIHFHSLNSPKYYNFSNDSINVLVSCNFTKIRKYLNENREDFDKYIYEHYTSYDWFWSWVSNNFHEFMIDDNLYKANHISAIISYIVSKLHKDNRRKYNDLIIYNVLDKVEPYMYVTEIPQNVL